MSDDNKKPLGRILLKQRAISPSALDEALAHQRADPKPLATQLTEDGTVTEIAALKALSEQSGVPGIDLSQVLIRLPDLEVLPREVAQRHKILPVLVKGDRVFVAMASPRERKILDEIEFVTGKRVYPYIALAGPLVRAIQDAYELRDRGEAFYIGPSCPEEVQKRAGVVPKPKLSEPPPLKLPASLTGAEPPAPPPVAMPAPREPQRVAEAQPRAMEIEISDLSMRPAQLIARYASLDAQEPERQSETPIIVDDALSQMAATDALGDAADADADRDQSVVTFLPSENDPKDTRKVVMIVDDEADIRRMLRRVFEERGFRVREADRGHLALRMVKEQPPDVMVLDAMLPEVHGFDIARRIKGTERYGHIPIIMVSANYRGWRIAEDLKSSYGVDAYIEKPFRVPEVVAAVEQAIQKTTVHAEQDRISADAERQLALGIEAYRAGDTVRAIAHLEHGTRIDPLAFRLHYHLGLLYGKEDRIYEAIQELETALDINGRHFAALKNLAVLHQRAGFRNKAIETWERALQVAPDEDTRKTVKEHLLALL